jgi:transposase
MMRSSRERARTAALFIAASAVAAMAHAKGYTTPAFRAKQTRPMRIAILPPHADFIKNKVLINDEMLHEAQVLEAEGARALAARLEALGYQARLLSPEQIERKPALAAAVKRVNDRYDEEWRKMVRKPRQVRQRRYAVGADVISLCSMLKVDGVAVARIQAVGVSKGKATFSAIMNMGPPAQRSYARLDMGVLEGRRGAVEAYFTEYESTSLRQLVNKPAHVIGQVAENALRRYPLSTEVEQVDEKDAEQASAPDYEGGDDPIEEFEMLLGQGASK